MIEITEHAERRMKQRLGIKGKELETRAKKAWQFGKKIEDVKSDKLKKYFNCVLSHSWGADGKTLRLSGNDLYIFTLSGQLITVYGLDKKLLQFQKVRGVKTYGKRV